MVSKDRQLHSFPLNHPKRTTGLSFETFLLSQASWKDLSLLQTEGGHTEAHSEALRVKAEHERHKQLANGSMAIPLEL